MKNKLMNIVIIILLCFVMLPAGVNAACLPGDLGYPNCTTSPSNTGSGSTEKQNACQQCKNNYGGASSGNCSGVCIEAQKEIEDNKKKQEGSGYEACKKDYSSYPPSSQAQYCQNAQNMTEEEYNEYSGKNEVAKKEPITVGKGPDLATTSYNIPSTTCGGSIKLPLALAEITSNAVTLLKIAVPIILVITGMLDFFKATAANDSDAVSKATKKLTRRIVAAIAAMLVITIVEFTFSTFGKATGEATVTSCINCFINGNC